MRKKNCFKKLGAVVMAVAMTAMMIPGVVSARMAETTVLTNGTIDTEGDHNINDPDVVFRSYGTFSYKSIKVDGSTKTVTMEDVVAEEEISTAIPGWTFVFKGTNKIGCLVAEDMTESQPSTAADIIIDVKAGGTVEATKGFFAEFNGKATLAKGVTADPEEWKNTNSKVTLTGAAETPKIVDGDDNETISASSDKDLVLKCEKDLPEEGFKFYFGGKELTSNECKVEKGSTIVTVYASYLDTLPGGDYEVTFSYPDGNVTNTVTLTKAAAEESEKKAPQTGEFSSMATTVLLISILGLAGLGFYAKKKEFF